MPFVFLFVCFSCDKFMKEESFQGNMVSLLIKFLKFSKIQLNVVITKMF